jgi:hypothetical protein
MRATCWQSLAGPSAAGPARPGVGRRPGGCWLCRPNSASCCLAGRAIRPGPVARSGTRWDRIRPPDRGGEGGRGKGEGEQERDEEGRRANNLVSWTNVRSRAFCYMHGQQGVSAGRRARRARQTISSIEISIKAGILLGGKHEACFMLGVAGIEPMPS